MRELVTIGTAIMFLTRAPVGKFCSGDAAVLAKATRYFPLVGALVGGALAVTLVLLLTLFPASVAVALMLVLAVLLTGAFHEDGLADVADSAGAFGLDRKLEIMRDSRVGTYGSLALVLLVLLKFLAVWELVQINVGVCLAALVAAHVLSRWGSVWLMATIAYARPEAANKVVAEGVNARRLLESSAWTVLLLLPVALLVSPVVYWMLPVAWLMVTLCGYRFKKVFGGITGDCLGAANQVVEVSIYLFAVAIWS